MHDWQSSSLCEKLTDVTHLDRDCKDCDADDDDDADDDRRGAEHR